MSRRPFALLILCLPIVLAQAPRLWAELHCAEAVVDKGEVRSGMSLAHRFVFSNHGAETVEIVDVRPSCGCLTPKLNKRRLRPNESGELLLQVNTLTQPAGANSWRVLLHYQAGEEEGELALYIRARVVTEISVEPPSLAIYTDSSIAHEIAVIDRRPQPLIVRAASASSPYVRTHLGELHRNEAGHWRRSIQVQVSSDCPEGTHEESLLIYTSDPQYPELTIPFTIIKRVRSAVSAAPKAVVLSASKGESLPARVVLLSAADGQEVKVDSVESDDAAIDCRWAPGPGQRATLKIRVDRKRIAGDHFRGVVRVRLSAPVEQTLTIPVRCQLH